MITLEDFKKADIRIGKVVSAEKVKGADKLLKLEVDIGSEKRQIITGMAEFYEPSHFVGKELPLLLNLEYKQFKGLESQGMILAADVDGKPVLLHPKREVPAGSVVK